MTTTDRNPAQKWSLSSLVVGAPHGRLAVQAWLASRLVLLIVLLCVVWTKGTPLGDAWQQWDADHFVHIASHGYTTLTETAYFPGLPLVMALFQLVGVPPVATGVLVSLAGSGMAAWALYRLTGGGAAGVVAVLAWSFAPMTVFTFVPYTEAVCCALAFWAFWYAKHDRWRLAATLAAGACAFRISGLFLIGALGLLALLKKPEPVGTGPVGPQEPSPLVPLVPLVPPWRWRLTRVAWLGLPTAVLAAYAIYLRVGFGSWTAWFEAQGEGWGRHFNWPWQAIQATLHTAGVFDGAEPSPIMMIFCWEVAACLIGTAVTVWCLLTRKVPEAGWVGVQVLALSCQTWLISLARSMVLWFPLFIFVSQAATTNTVHRGKGGSGGSKVIRRLVGVVLFACEVAWMTWWASGYFSGGWSG